jgi:hypothetical protein
VYNSVEAFVSQSIPLTFKKKNMKNYTIDQFKMAVQQSTSIAQALIILNKVPKGGNYGVFNRFVKKHNIDISHFRGQGWSKNKTFKPKRSLEEYLSNKHPIGSHKLKKRLIKEKILKYECSKCKLTKWQNQPIPIELDHIDGNTQNNNLNNLRILCPNCHAQTSTYRRSKVR